MKSMFTVIKEQIQNFYLVRRLSVYEMKITNSNNYLGSLWEIINPMIQILIYWFVFGFLIKTGPRDGTEFFPWLLSGIIVWFFVNQATIEASKSIYSKLAMVSKMSFPMSVIPSYVIFARLYQHLMLLGISILILCITGIFPSVYIVQIPYFLFAVVALLISFSLITSTLSTIIRDVHMMVPSFLRILFYLTPILWIRDDLPDWIMAIMKANPLFYIVQGYRATLLGESWYFIEHWQYTLYFWVIVIVLFIVGSSLHLKFRDRFVDFM
ncbi:ABC transporter permease [Bacillus sp. V59.32b]|uniref:ABC transporter permease n=1 Tax=Bacillus sp. V59.32b TaxID=1758642 RepID=UPI000E3D20E8|nr:ABC transporter permease [Bacillus sp. V59.32b]RFU66847.1 ABC transporter permease [Bacillus sp. V59.32b]